MRGPIHSRFLIFASRDLVQLGLEHERHVLREIGLVFFRVGITSDRGVGHEVGAIGQLNIDQGCGTVADSGHDLARLPKFTDQGDGVMVTGDIEHCFILNQLGVAMQDGRERHTAVSSRVEDYVKLPRTPKEGRNLLGILPEGGLGLHKLDTLRVILEGLYGARVQRSVATFQGSDGEFDIR
jgi:hypothetical protein